MQGSLAGGSQSLEEEFTLMKDMVVATLGPVVMILSGLLVELRFLRIQIPNHSKDPYNKVKLRGAGPGKELTKDYS